MSGKDSVSLAIGEKIYLSESRETEFMGQQHCGNGSKDDCHRVSRLTKDNRYSQRRGIEFMSLQY